MTSHVNEINQIIGDINKKFKIKNTFKTVIATSISFLIAFAWRDAIRDSIDNLIKETHVDEYRLWHKYPHVMYALFITIFGMVVLYALGESYGE